MFADYVFEKSSAQYSDKLLLIDDENLNQKTGYTAAFSAHGFEIVHYEDDLSFRLNYEAKLKTSGSKIVVLVRSDTYVPYDIHRRLRAYIVSLHELFPRLNAEVLAEMKPTGLDLLSAVYPKNFEQRSSRQETEQYIRASVYAQENVRSYLNARLTALKNQIEQTVSYKTWFSVAREKAQLDVMAVQYGVVLETDEINRRFQDYLLADFGKLSQNIDRDSPVLVSKAMDYMHERSDKFVIVVMDGMSGFDWEILSQSFDGISYAQSAVFAMLPSTTSVSRQCLLSNKYPSQLEEPWKQSKEKAEFFACAKSLGYADRQIAYERGYNAQFSSFVRCGAVIINDVDDMVHAQPQGRLGMFNDITVLSNERKLVEMTRRFLAEGFDVYISADHGNTACTGLGKLMGTGVEVETKSRKFLVLKDFADKEKLMQKANFVEFPKYYLPKGYDYLICNVGESLDAKGDKVMTHGGLSLDEVVVPFITIKAVQKNG
jgi:hypothetical protein